MKCTVVYDNEKDGALKAGWGFSCLVEAHGKKVLFDTGDEGNALIYNLERLGIEIKGIDCVFISHGHWDHCGGLSAFLDKRGSLPVFVPESAFRMLDGRFGKKAEFRSVSGPGELFAGFNTTGELKNIEQSLVVEGEKGNVVICGCAHPGLEAIIEKARVFGKVHAVIGGFHGFDRLSALEGIVSVPCHCTAHKKDIKERFPESCSECRTGSVFDM